MRLQFLLPIAGIVSTWLALSIIWWSLQRRKEREAFYRHELARRMVERYDEGQAQVLEWLREQDAADARRARDVLKAVGWVLLFGGSAALIGLGFTPRDESLFGLVPIGVALGIFAYLLQTRRG